MNNPYLMRTLAMGPVMLKELLEVLPDSLFDVKEDPERFSLREAVAHLADWEPINLARMQMAVQSPGATIQGIDESERAVERGYANANPRFQIEQFAERRGLSLAFLNSLLPEQWAFTVVHTEKGTMTLYDQANMMLAHDVYHVEHLLRYLRLRG